MLRVLSLVLSLYFILHTALWGKTVNECWWERSWPGVVISVVLTILSAIFSLACLIALSHS